MLPVLTCPPVILRPWRDDDAPTLAALANNRAVARNLTHLFPHPYTQADAVDWIAMNIGPSPRLSAWAIEADGQLVGGCGFNPGEGVFSRTAEIGYWIGEPFWGRGFATATVRGMCDWAFRERDWLRVEAFVYAWNPPSMRVLEKAGFRREGLHPASVERFGEVGDRVSFGRLRDRSGGEG
jgi:RimJ/RimL family protein N-acetyltransferase